MSAVNACPSVSSGHARWTNASCRRDRNGLPESIRFWKACIEETDDDFTFPVGLIYGPSGCGKSSLVKAGLLPRLAPHVLPVYLEATAEGTPGGLRRRLAKLCPELPADLDLSEALAELRRGKFLPGGKKVLLVLDQFEQWLHAKREEQEGELVAALRQCNGGRVQAVLLVRDDFGMAATRFMAALDLPIVQGQNFATVDLFDLPHARKVLAQFGRAFGRLPEHLDRFTREHNAFLDRAVTELAQDGKVISVRLALFAEMVKGRPWTPATLKTIGGTQGVGTVFLEETFSASATAPQHRLHQKAAQAVLKALLPETGTALKGHMRSRQELLEVSGYASRPRDFEEILRILDGELRLITPTDPEGKEEASPSPGKVDEKYYQLTHDYLVHSLRDWLTRKQKETRRGRAELLLADRAAVWNARPENRQLPSLLQWFQIKWLTQKKNRTPPQRKMLAKASRYHEVRGIMVGLLLALLGLAAYEGHGRLQARALRDRLLDANTDEVPTIVADMSWYRRWIDPLLRAAATKAEASKDERKQLHVSLALLPVDARQVDYLTSRLLEAAPHEVPIIRDALETHKDGLLDKLWAVVEAPEKGKEKQRLRAASALAKYDPDSEKWAKVQEAVSNDLVKEPPVYLAPWMDSLRPVRVKLLASLSEVYGSSYRRDVERSLATNILADYAADQPKVLANLVMDADVQQFAIFFPKLKDRGEQGLLALTSEIDKKLPPNAMDDARENLAKRQANAAVALLRMNQPAKVWPLFKHSSDPRVRSYLIHRLHLLGADAKAVVKRLDAEPNVTIRRALLLSLGEYGEKGLLPAARKALLPKLQDIYQSNADPGLHAAAEWLLRTWKQEAWLKQINNAWAKDKKQRQQRLDSIQQLVAKGKDKAPPQWYVNCQGQTMVVIPGPVVFVMGSPLREAGRQADEVQHKKRIDRTFAVAAKSVTLAEYRRFDATYSGMEQWARTADSPVIGTSWYQAVSYCNWLSEQEGMPQSEWCYEPLIDPQAMPALAGSSVGLLAGSLGPLAAACGLFPGRTDPAYKEGMKLAGNYLQRKGYRLPTEAEMEYATRAGAVTARYYGETEELLEKYAWYFKNGQERTWPVGNKKPNDNGMFDIQGNVWAWCQERYSRYPPIKSREISDDKEDTVLVVRSTDSRVLRGGSFDGRASYVRSATRSYNVPPNGSSIVAFRLARTITP
jgi:formylglycine-generating enzyme required for sulfatase activity